MPRLSSYREVLWPQRRWFDLYEDRIEVRLKSPALEGESTILLHDLRLTPHKIVVRQSRVKVGIQMIVMGVIAGMYAIWPNELPLQLEAGVAGLVIGLLGVVLILMPARRIEHAQFVSHSGNVLLAVTDSGPDRSDFQDFVDVLTEQIRKAHDARPTP